MGNLYLWSLKGVENSQNLLYGISQGLNSGHISHGLVHLCIQIRILHLSLL